MKLLVIAVTGFALTTVWSRNRDLLASAPDTALNLRNPLQGEQARRAGAKLYARECAACHGKSGEGLRNAPPLAREDVRQVPPGALFWVLRNGALTRGMPSFAHLPEPQRWQIIAYLQRAAP